MGSSPVGAGYRFDLDDAGGCGGQGAVGLAWMGFVIAVRGGPGRCGWKQPQIGRLPPPRQGPGRSRPQSTEMSPLDTSRAVTFATADDFYEWLARRGSEEQELIVGIYKKGSGKQTVTLDELQLVALCHGWIDGKAGSIDEERWAVRFTPRRPRSNWSDVNRERARRLIAEGRMAPAGLAALPEDLER